MDNKVKRNMYLKRKEEVILRESMGIHEAHVLVYENLYIRKKLTDQQTVDNCRKHHGLPPIMTKTRNCNQCGEAFESTGNRNCGCKHGYRTGSMAGREVLS